MFDQMPAAAATRAERLEIGDVAIFEIMQEGAGEQPRRRPWLLIDHVTRLGRLCAVLAPLQQDSVRASRGYEVLITLPRDLRAAGLRRRAVFGCRRPRIVALDELSAVRIGCLQGDRLERLHAVRARLDAERDIRRDRLRLRREEIATSQAQTARSAGAAAS